MQKTLFAIAGATVCAAIVTVSFRASAQTAGDSLIADFRLVEVASVSDAVEQLYGTRAYMGHEMRPLAPAKFAGPAVTLKLVRDENKEGSRALQPMLDVIDDSPSGSVYVMVLERAAPEPFSFSTR